MFQPKRQQTKKKGKEIVFLLLFYDGHDLNNLFQSKQQPTTHKWGDEAGSSGKFGHIAFGSSSLSGIIIIIWLDRLVSLVYIALDHHHYLALSSLSGIIIVIWHYHPYLGWIVW